MYSFEWGGASVSKTRMSPGGGVHMCTPPNESAYTLQTKIARSWHSSKGNGAMKRELRLSPLIIGTVLALGSCSARDNAPSGSFRIAPVAGNSETPTSAKAKPTATHERSNESLAAPPPVVQLLLYAHGVYRIAEVATLIDAHWSTVNMEYADGRPIRWPGSIRVSTERDPRLVFRISLPPDHLILREYGVIGANREPQGPPLIDERIDGREVSLCDGFACINLPLKGTGERFIALSGVWVLPGSGQSRVHIRNAAWLLRVTIER